MAIAISYYGNNIKIKDANNAIYKLRNETNQIRFVEWSQTGFQMSVNGNQGFKKTIFDNQKSHNIMKYSESGGIMVSNNVGISQVIQNRIVAKYDKLAFKECGQHWFLGEGLEIGDFIEARENLGFLEKDYCDTIYEWELDGGNSCDD